MFYYAVFKGRIPGIYDTWDKCQQQVNGFPASKFKKFKTLPEAQHFTKTGTELLSSLKKTKSLISNAKNIVSNTQLQNKTTNNISKKIYDTNDSITIYTDGSLIRLLIDSIILSAFVPTNLAQPDSIPSIRSVTSLATNTGTSILGASS